MKQVCVPYLPIFVAFVSSSIVVIFVWLIYLSSRR